FSVMLKTAGSRTVTATDISNGAKTANSSPAITLNAGAFAKLQLLVPGETAAPGTALGKIGSPLQQMTGEAFPVSINAVDVNWNKVTTVADVVNVSSSDTAAVLPANTALTAGTQTLNITLKTVGSATITSRDVTDSSKTLATSAAIAVALPLY